MRTGVKTEFAKSLRRNMTDAEKKLWYYLRAPAVSVATSSSGRHPLALPWSILLRQL